MRCGVRQASISLGRCSFSRELPLSGPWARYRGTHLQLQATEEIHKPTAFAASPVSMVSLL